MNIKIPGSMLSAARPIINTKTITYVYKSEVGSILNTSI